MCLPTLLLPLQYELMPSAVLVLRQVCWQMGEERKASQTQPLLVALHLQTANKTLVALNHLPRKSFYPRLKAW
jgi:hypothetical protein